MGGSAVATARRVGQHEGSAEASLGKPSSIRKDAVPWEAFPYETLATIDMRGGQRGIRRACMGPPRAPLTCGVATQAVRLADPTHIADIMTQQRHHAYQRTS